MYCPICQHTLNTSYECPIHGKMYDRNPKTGTPEIMNDYFKPKRPYCCPDPACKPVIQLKDSDYPDLSRPEPGESWIYIEKMQTPVSFEYDGVKHTNDLNQCDYTPLKGLIRWQTNKADLNALAGFFKEASKKTK